MVISILYLHAGEQFWVSVCCVSEEDGVTSLKIENPIFKLVYEDSTIEAKGAKWKRSYRGVILGYDITIQGSYLKPGYFTFVMESKGALPWMIPCCALTDHEWNALMTNLNPSPETSGSRGRPCTHSPK